jgi:hypothetical protein
MIQQGFNDVLCARDPFQVMVGLCKKPAQPFFAPDGFGKVEFMKNGIFFFLVKDGNVVERDFVYLHVLKGSTDQRPRANPGAGQLLTGRTDGRRLSIES